MKTISKPHAYVSYHRELILTKEEHDILLSAVKQALEEERWPRRDTHGDQDQLTSVTLYFNFAPTDIAFTVRVEEVEK